MTPTTPLDLLHAGPAAGFDRPFDLLEACHGRVDRMLCLLERLAAHLAAHGADDQARRAAADITRYFDIAGQAYPAVRAALDNDNDNDNDMLQHMGHEMALRRGAKENA